MEPALSPLRSQNKPSRRRLQKSDPKLKGLKLKRGSADSTASRKIETPSLSPRHIQNGAPDLSDSKWNHYLRPKTLVSPISPELEPEPHRWPQTVKPQRTIPEFSHLTIHDASARPSLDSSSIPSPASSTSTTSTMRRQAKTPVFRIGQLEDKQNYGNYGNFGRDPETAEKTSSVELIAEQYRALLESRGGPETESIYEDSQKQNDEWQAILDVPVDYRLLSPGFEARPTSRSRPEPLRKLRPPSHLSLNTEDEMVHFEEDAIYFRPVSFSTETSPQPSPQPSPRRRSFGSRLSPRPSSGNLSLQICVDLLTRELSSALVDRPARNGTDNSALQIWVMIEAYERLRDQVMSMASINPEIGKVSQIFDSWLSALYTIHETMIRSSTVPKEAEYMGLQEELD